VSLQEFEFAVNVKRYGQIWCWFVLDNERLNVLAAGGGVV
jgi:hypothetical protein